MLVLATRDLTTVPSTEGGAEPFCLVSVLAYNNPALLGFLICAHTPFLPPGYGAGQSGDDAHSLLGLRGRNRPPLPCYLLQAWSAGHCARGKCPTDGHPGAYPWEGKTEQQLSRTLHLCPVFSSLVGLPQRYG